MQQIPASKQRELGAAALRAYPNIAKTWGLKEKEAARLLGVPESTYRRWRKAPEKAGIDVNHLERLSLILGIYKGLHILLPRKEAADTWIRRNNSHPRFGGRPPLERMLGGQVADLVVVREHLDAARG